MNFNQNPLKIFFSYYRPHLKLFIADMFCAAIIAFIDVTFPMFTRYSLNVLIPDYKLKLFIILILILFAGYALRWFCNWFVAYWGHVFGGRVEQDMRRDVFAHLEQQSFSRFI